MPFTSKEAMEAAVGGASQLAYFSNPTGAGVANDEAIAKAIVQADADIVASCAGRPGFGDAGFATAIEGHATALAVGYLFSNVWSAIPEGRHKVGFSEAKALLKLVREGYASVVTTSAAPVVNVSTVDWLGPGDDEPDDSTRDNSLRLLKGF
jgi:hypothetical protein